MLYKRRFYLKWISIIVAYICIFFLSYELGTKNRQNSVKQTTSLPRHLLIKRLFNDHGQYVNSSMILQMIYNELNHPLLFDNNDKTNTEKKSFIRHGLVIFYDYSYHHIYFQQFLWLYSSWMQLTKNFHIKNDLILFISSPMIPDDFQKLINLTRHTHKYNQFLIYPCQTLTDSVLQQNFEYLNHFSGYFHMELARLFYWQQTRLSSLLLFLHDEYRIKLLNYDYIFRLDIDSFFMPNFAYYYQKSSLSLGETIPSDQYTLNRLKRIEKYFSVQSKASIHQQTITISWFGKLDVLTNLTRQIILMTVWLMKEEFTESERLHHLTYLNYPSWYIDGIFEYATAIILSLNQYEKYPLKNFSPLDCHHLLTNCFHISLRDPSHHLHLSKHALYLLTNINQSNLTENELYIYRTVIKANGMFKLYFNSNK